MENRPRLSTCSPPQPQGHLPCPRLEQWASSAAMICTKQISNMVCSRRQYFSQEPSDNKEDNKARRVGKVRAFRSRPSKYFFRLNDHFMLQHCAYDGRAVIQHSVHIKQDSYKSHFKRWKQTAAVSCDILTCRIHVCTPREPTEKSKMVA
jgi:hypothetical protein